MKVSMKITLEELVRQYGTNLLLAPLSIGSVLKFELYGRQCKIIVVPGENCDPPVAGDVSVFWIDE